MKNKLADRCSLFFPCNREYLCKVIYENSSSVLTGVACGNASYRATEVTICTRQTRNKSIKPEYTKQQKYLPFILFFTSEQVCVVVLQHKQFHLLVQVKGCDLCVVSFEVGEVEKVWWGLLLPGLPAGGHRKNMYG